MKISPENDVDFYHISVPKGGVLNIVVRNMPAISLVLSLLSTDDVRLKNITAMTYNRTVDMLRLPCLVKAGQYFIKVESENYAVSAQEFTVTASMDSFDTLEWNNDTANATVMKLGPTYRGSIFPTSDYDFYRLTLDSNQIVRATLDSFSMKPNFNAQIDLLDFEGTQIDYKYITSGVSNIFGYSLKKGTYYFQIYDVYGDASSELRYKFSVSKDTTDPTEWNDDTAHAYQAALGDTMKATMFPVADIDFFKFTVGQADTIRFSVDSISSKLPSFQMYLFDKELVGLGSANDDGQGSLRYKKYLVPGQYFIKIFSGYTWDGESSEKLFYFTIKTGL